MSVSCTCKGRHERARSHRKPESRDLTEDLDFCRPLSKTRASRSLLPNRKGHVFSLRARKHRRFWQTVGVQWAHRHDSAQYCHSSHFYRGTRHRDSAECTDRPRGSAISSRSIMTSHVSRLSLTSPGLIVPSTGFSLAKARGLNSGHSKRPSLPLARPPAGLQIGQQPVLQVDSGRWAEAVNMTGLFSHPSPSQTLETEVASWQNDTCRPGVAAYVR